MGDKMVAYDSMDFWITALNNWAFSLGAVESRHRREEDRSLL